MLAVREMQLLIGAPTGQRGFTESALGTGEMHGRFGVGGCLCVKSAWDDVVTILVIHFLFQ